LCLLHVCIPPQCGQDTELFIRVDDWNDTASIAIPVGTGRRVTGQVIITIPVSWPHLLNRLGDRWRRLTAAPSRNLRRITCCLLRFDSCHRTFTSYVWGEEPRCVPCPLLICYELASFC